MIPVASKIRRSPSVATGNRPIGHSAANASATGSLPSSSFASNGTSFS